MRTRPTEWLDTRTGETLYSLEAHHNGRWMKVAEGGEPCIYHTPEERDAKRAEVRKMGARPKPPRSYYMREGSDKREYPEEDR